MKRVGELGAGVGRELSLGATRREDMIPLPLSERQTPGRNRIWPRGPAPGLEEEETESEEGPDLAVREGEKGGVGAETQVGGREKGRDPVRGGPARKVNLIQRNPRRRKVPSQLRRKRSC